MDDNTGDGLISDHNKIISGPENPSDVPENVLQIVKQVKVPENPLVRKAKKICAVGLHESFVTNLDFFGTLVDITDPASRRSLQSKGEQRVLLEHQQFKSDLDMMLKRMEDEYDQVKSVHDDIVRKIENLEALKQSSKKFMEASQRINSDSKHNNLKLQMVQSFLSRFTLAPREVEQLTSAKPGDRTLSREFFSALRRVEGIHEDCKTLLRVHSGSQLLGMQLMETVAKYQEVGFQKLYRWSLEESRKLTSEVPVVLPALCESLGILQSRPVVLAAILDEYATTRKQVVSNAFIDALTQGNSTSSRPLEIHSYDALRYTTDMLGWVHQAVATEKDYWLSLTKDMPETLRQDNIGRVLNTIMEGLIRPLKSRIDRVIESNQGPVVLYKFRHWTGFYIEKIRTSISAPEVENILLQLLLESSASIYSRYVYALRNFATQMGKKIEVPPENLEPNPTVNKILLELRELLTCQESLHGLGKANEDVTTIMTIVFEPLLQMCNESANHVTPNNPTTAATYSLNCLFVMKSSLFGTDMNGDPRSELLNRQCDAHIDTLVKENSTNIINAVRLRPLLDTLRSPEESRNVPDDFEMEQFLIAFDHYLANPEDFHLKELRLLLSVNFKNTVIQTSQQLISDFYKQIYPVLLATKFAPNAKNPDLVHRLIGS